MRRIAALVVTAGLAGCGGSAPKPTSATPTPTPTPEASATPAPAPAPTDEQRLQTVLDRRAAALEHRRAGAYARTAAARERPADELAARRLRRLGVRDVTLQAESVHVAGSRARLRVRLGYRVNGVAGRFGGVRELAARRTRGGWRLAGPVAPRGRAPWEVDDYGEVVSPHFVVWVPAGLDAGPLTAALEDGYGRMQAILRKGRLRRRYLVVVARDAAAARRLTGRIRGLDGLVALTDTEVRQSGAAERVAEVASQRLVVIWPAFVAMGPDGRRIAITHELTHAALAPVTSGRTPGWLTEGIALYVSGDDRTAEADALGRVPLRRLSRPDAFARLSGEAQRRAYATASATAFAIAERFGRRALLRFYLAFNSPSLHGAAGDPSLAKAAARRVLGVPLSAL